MHAAYREVGSFRAAAEICGTTPKTVKRSVLAAQAAESAEISVVEHNYDAVRDIVIERVERTKGKISAKRLLPIAHAAGYRVRRVTFAAWSPRSRLGGGRRTTGEDDPASGRRAPCWSLTGARSARSSSSAP